MVDIIQPLDFLGRMGGPANLPNLIGDANAITQQREREAATIDTLRANAMANQAQAMQAAQEQQRAQQFQQALATHLGDGSAQSTARLMTQFPEFAKQLGDAHALENADIQEADTLQLNGIYSRASNGDWAGAAANAKRRLDAEKAAGNDTTDEQDLYDALTSNDPVLQKRALGIVGMDLAARVGLDKFASVYGGVTTADGNVIDRGTGRVIYQGKPTARTPIKMDGGTDDFGNKLPDYLVDPETYQRIEVGGDTPTSSGSMGGSTGVQPPTSGGAPATGSRAARNNNPGNLEASEWTQRQPGYVGTDGRFAVFDTPANGAAAMTSLLANNYLAKGVNTIGGIISKYAPASDGNNVNAYVGAVSKATGIKPNQPLTPDDLPAVVAAMAQVEGGGSGGATAGRERTQKELAFRYGAPPAGQILTQDGTRIRDPLSEKGSGKTLPAPTVDKLNLQAETTAQIVDLIGGFQDGFSGPNFGNATGASNLAGRMGADGFAAQADWWQRMGQFDNVVRNELFGASLTAGEQAAWKSTTVTPTMAPARVRANLSKRREILDRALARKVKTYGAAGYNIEDVGAELIAPATGGWSVVEVPQ